MHLLAVCYWTSVSLLLKRERWKGSCTTWFREASQKLFAWATVYVLEESTRLTPETHQEPNGLWWRKWYLEGTCSREGSHSSSREQGDWRWKGQWPLLTSYSSIGLEALASCWRSPPCLLLWPLAPRDLGCLGYLLSQGSSHFRGTGERGALCIWLLPYTARLLVCNLYPCVCLLSVPEINDFSHLQLFYIFNFLPSFIYCYVSVADEIGNKCTYLMLCVPNRMLLLISIIFIALALGNSPNIISCFWQLLVWT